MFNKIAETMELYETPEAKSFGAGMEGFIKKAELSEEDAEIFIKAAAEVRLQQAQAENANAAFSIGFQKFAYDVGLSEEEFANFSEIAGQLLAE